MGKIGLILILILIGGCVSTPPPKIPVEIPQQKTVIVVPKAQSPKNKNPQVYSDLTRGTIDNLSQEVIKVWFDRKAGKPGLTLQPGMSSGDIFLPIGSHHIYIERWTYTRYGLRFREGTVVRVKVGEFSPRRGENYGWEVQIKNDWVSTPWGNYYFYRRR